MAPMELILLHILVIVEVSEGVQPNGFMPLVTSEPEVEHPTRGPQYQVSRERSEWVFSSRRGNLTWPYRDQVAIIPGNISIGGLMMVHERDEDMICGKIMPQGGLQATEAMLYTVDKINEMEIIPGVKLGARIKDDCDRDIYGLEQSVDFIRGKEIIILFPDFLFPDYFTVSQYTSVLGYKKIWIKSL